MKTIAFVTSRAMPDMNPREAGAIAELRTRGCNVVPYIWSENSHEARTYDAIVVRSPWDYYEHLDEFIPWVKRLPETRVFNPKNILLWNLDKNYLRELEGLGVDIVPTVWFTGVNVSELRSTIAESPWEEMVLKPVRSAGAFKTYRFQKGQLPPLEDLVGMELMLQPMMNEILTEGEWSLVYFEGKFSHAIVKQPKSGDFRVQYTHGGKEIAVTAPAEVLEFGSKVLNAVPERLLYARVDFVRSNGKCLLMELEVLEPDLFFGSDPASSVRFADALLEMMRDDSQRVEPSLT